MRTRIVIALLATGLAAACSSKGLPSSSSSPAAAADGGPSCPPSLPSDFTPVFKPPPNAAHVCDAAQLADFRRLCFAPETADQGACAAWQAANADCFGCAFSAQDDAAWGPLVAARFPAEVDFTNVGGCIAAADPSSEPCGERVQAELQCLLAACGRCEVAEPSDLDARRTTIDALNGCFDAAIAGDCARFANAATSCLAGLPAAASTCVAMNDDLDALFQALDGMCGGAAAPPPPAADAGVPEAGGRDAAPEAGRDAAADAASDAAPADAHADVGTD